MNNNLKIIRNELGLSLEKLGDMCGMSKSHIYQLEKSNSSPTLKTAYLISAVVGKTVYQIWPDTTEIVEETITVRRVITK